VGEVAGGVVVVVVVAVVVAVVVVGGGGGGGGGAVVAVAAAAVAAAAAAADAELFSNRVIYLWNVVPVHGAPPTRHPIDEGEGGILQRRGRRWIRYCYRVQVGRLYKVGWEGGR